MINPIVIVPYRDRAEHLERFAETMEQLRLSTYIIEQNNRKPFNRAKLLNVGAVIADGSPINYTHFIFHDVDMIPMEDHYREACLPTAACHMATECSQFNYTMPYPDYFGGVTVFPKESFKAVNGYSNSYWGWGAEDDDIRERCLRSNVPIVRIACRFESLPHKHALTQAENKVLHRKNVERLKAATREMRTDGINKLDVIITEYKHINDFVTKVTVDI
jgi:hypothetical protein